MKRIKENRAITLVALVVTIVILLILAGVSVNMALGNNGIAKKAQDAKKNTEMAATDESQTLDSIEQSINQFTGAREKIAVTNYYDSLEDAINDANNDVTTNGKEYFAEAKAKIEIDEQNNVFVLPLDDVSINTEVQVGSAKGYTLDLNNKTITLSENGYFSQQSGKKLVLDDNGTSGNIIKNVNSSTGQQIIKSSGELVLNNGTYSLINSGKGDTIAFRMENTTCILNGGRITSENTDSGIVSDIQITGTEANTVINNVSCSAKSVNAIARDIAVFGEENNEQKPKMIINDGEFKSFSGKNMALGCYFVVVEATINNGNFEAVGDKNSQFGIACMLANGENDIIVNNVKMNSSGNAAFGIVSQNNKNGKFQINNCEIFADAYKGNGMGIQISNSVIEINDGNVITEGGGPGAIITSENCVINGGYFRGIHSGIQINSKSSVAHINGGTFESPTHGGMYILRKCKYKERNVKAWNL